MVSPVGAFKTITTATDPRFIDTLNRPSLAQTFERNATGARLTVVVNHLKSKGSDCNAVGDPDTGDGPGNCNITRTNAAKALVDWLATDPTGSGDPDFLFIGDFNSYTFEDPIDWITTHGYTNLVRQAGGLDPVLVRVQRRVRLPRPRAGHRLARGAGDRHRRLAHQPRRADRARLQRRVQDAPTRSTPSTTRVRTARRITTRSSSASSSPHAPTVDAGGPYAVVEGGSVIVSATGTESGGGALTYNWDLDDNGTFETPGQSVTFSAAGLEAPDSLTIAVQATGPTGLTATDEATVNVIWDFEWKPPIVDLPAVNEGGPGKLTLTFGLGGNQGLDIFRDRLPGISVVPMRHDAADRRQRAGRHRGCKGLQVRHAGRTSTCSTGRSAPPGRTPAGCSSWAWPMGRRTTSRSTSSSRRSTTSQATRRAMAPKSWCR